MSKFTYVLTSILIIVIALIFYLSSKVTSKYDSLYKEYNYYRDSTLAVNKTLQHKVDSISTIKKQIITKIKYISVYTDQFKRLPDSTLAEKVDSVFLSHNDNSFISPTVVMKVGSIDAFILDKRIVVDYISSAYLLNSYTKLAIAKVEYLYKEEKAALTKRTNDALSEQNKINATQMPILEPGNSLIVKLRNQTAMDTCNAKSQTALNAIKAQAAVEYRALKLKRKQMLKDIAIKIRNTKDSCIVSIQEIF
jgi:hypothetical protein